MSSDLQILAEQLEGLFPAILQQLYPAAEDEPLGELPLMQLRVMRSLADGARPVSAIGADLRMSPSRLAHLLARLEESGFIVRTDDERDRRVRIAAMTSQGQERMDARRRTRSGRLLEVLKRMSESERAMVLSSLVLLKERSESGLHAPVELDLEPVLP